MRLPLNCTVDYISDFLNPDEAAELHRTLIDDYQIDQAQLVVEAGGQKFVTDSYRILFLPSLSLGEVRKFAFKQNASGEVYSLDLANGSLLVMGNHCQDRYTHSLLKDPAYRKPRINITFREPGFQ